MNITMEQVEKVRSCTGVSREAARDALERSGGSVLDAVILLEKEERERAAGQEKESSRTGLGQVIRSLVGNSLSIYLEVRREEETTCRVPLLVAVVLLVVATWAMLALLAVGLCCGYGVHVTGPGTEGWGEGVNRLSDQVSGVISDAVRSLRGDKKKK